MALVQAVLTAQQVGTLLGLAVLAAVLLTLVRRVIAARPVPSASPAFTPLPRACPPEHAASIPPPGTPATPAPVLRVAPRPQEAWPRRRAIEAVGAVVVAVLLTVAIVRVADGGHSRGVWSTDAGRATRTLFVAGCTRGSGANPGRCGCLFDRITSQPPYDTFAGFSSLASDIRARGGYPPAVIAAARSCFNAE